MLSDLHRRALVDESGISEAVIEARGYRTISDPAELLEVGFAKYQAGVPGLLIPIHGVDGCIAQYHYRPDMPRIGKDKKQIKYEALAGRSLRLDVPPAAVSRLGDPNIPLLITEGSKKADSAVSRGWCCIGLMGVWGFLGTNELGGRMELSDWRGIALNDRLVYVCFDSDVMTKPSVYDALVALGNMLQRKGAKTRFVVIPSDGKSKVGLDDWLAGGGAIEELISASSETPPGQNPDDVAIQRLLALSQFQREREFKAVAAELNVSVTSLKSEVKARDKAARKSSESQGNKIQFNEIEPWEDPVIGSEVLDDLAAWFSRYVVLPKFASVALGLWIVHTFVYDLFDWTPKIGIVSPEKRCGKSTLLKVMQSLAPRPISTDNISTAALFRVISQYHPVVFMDEADAYSKQNEDLRRMLNSSSEKGKAVLRCVGEDQEAKSFNVFGPLAYAMIDMPWDTVADRSIMIMLRRKTSNDRAITYRSREASEPAATLARKAARLALDLREGLECARPTGPSGLDDRALDIWEPLFAIADAVAGPWPELARSAAIHLSGGRDEEHRSPGVRLLTDIRSVFTGDRMTSDELCAVLIGIGDGHWKECRRGDKPIDQRHLAKLLKPYGIIPKPVRLGSCTPRGYTREMFDDAFLRYLSGDLSATPQQALESVEFEPEFPKSGVAATVGCRSNDNACRNTELSEGKRSEMFGNEELTDVAVLRLETANADDKEYL